MIPLPRQQPVDPRVEELGAIVALMRSQVLPVDHLASWISYFGSAVELVRQIGDDQLPLAEDFGPTGAVTPDELKRSIRDARHWIETGHDVRTVLDSEYPTNLHDVFNRPAFVFVKGQWHDDLDNRSVAVVGARAASDAGVKRAAQVARDLARSGVTVVSGLAKGIDAAAHTAALKAGGRTVAVMGTGIDRVYPAENASLADQIVASGGALMSQYLPKQPPTKWTFPKRNVVMSGLTLATVVIEATETSGARMQARVALQHGRTVFLLKSLVESHDWARRYTTEGIHGSVALVAENSEAIVSRFAHDGGVPSPIVA